MLRLRLVPCFLLVFAASACNSNKDHPGGGTDAGIMVMGHDANILPGTDAGSNDAGPGEMTDSGPTAMGGVGTCDAPIAVTGVLGSMVSASFDTTGASAGPLTLNTDCITLGMGDTSPPQTVVAYHVPGTGSIAISFTLLNDATSAMFDTVVEVRTDACTTAPTDSTNTCFDDTDTGGKSSDTRSSGRFAAMGGTTVYFVITGYPGTMAPATLAGPGRIDITAASAVAPTLTAATVTGEHLGTGPTASFAVGVTAAMGGDGDGDATYASATLLNASGAAVDTNGDSMVDATDDVQLLPDMDLTGMMTFTFTASGGTDSDVTGVTQARLVMFDSLGNMSTPLMVPVTTISHVGFGVTCDATHLCDPDLACDGTSHCAPAAAATTACMSATTLPFTAPSSATMGTTSMVDITIPGGASAFSGSCGGVAGREKVLSLAIPSGTPAHAYDVRVETQFMGTGMAPDTVLYVRTTCGDPASEVMDACNDDSGDTGLGRYLSRLSFVPAPGTTYSVVTDLLDMATADTMIRVVAYYRPLLAHAAACDPMGRNNACMMGTCPATGTAVCP